jgi:hypothetical protein
VHTAKQVRWVEKHVQQKVNRLQPSTKSETCLPAAAATVSKAQSKQQKLLLLLTG